MGRGWSQLNPIKKIRVRRQRFVLIPASGFERTISHSELRECGLPSNSSAPNLQLCSRGPSLRPYEGSRKYSLRPYVGISTSDGCKQLIDAEITACWSAATAGFALREKTFCSEEKLFSERTP